MNPAYLKAGLAVAHVIAAKTDRRKDKGQDHF
jgi:hypothetical protein